MAREEDHNWFLSQEWVGMALYSDGFAGNLQGLTQRLPYLQELGVNLVHVMPILKCPQGASDGGYAVSDFRDIDPRAGNVEDVVDAGRGDAQARHAAHARRGGQPHLERARMGAAGARAGDAEYQKFYYIFPNRDVPDMFEETLPEIFPETAPGNFTWDEAMGKWVMTVFNNYQWDLNYSNPAVFIEMLDIILFWANQGADIVRLDAVAFLWKKIGTTCAERTRGAPDPATHEGLLSGDGARRALHRRGDRGPVGDHQVLRRGCGHRQGMRDRLQRHLHGPALGRGRDQERQAAQPGHQEPARTSSTGRPGSNYLRCHDDIGLGFDDADIRACDYDPYSHRRFLVDWFTGAFEGSPARGRPFGVNPKTGDARIAGALASLAGLESALEAERSAGHRSGRWI